MSDLVNRSTEMERLLRECRALLLMHIEGYNLQSHVIQRIDTAINAGAQPTEPIHVSDAGAFNASQPVFLKPVFSTNLQMSDVAINAGVTNEDVDTGRGHTEAQDNLPVAPAPNASPPPATAKPISCALRGVGQGGVAGLAPHRRVVCAAIRAVDNRIMVGIRHYSRDMQDQMTRYFSSISFQNRLDEDQGFVDQHGIYMSREEAYKVALAAGQIIYPERCGEGLDGKKLYSEGLY